jgi:hypothetical protein
MGGSRQREYKLHPLLESLHSPRAQGEIIVIAFLGLGDHSDMKNLDCRNLIITRDYIPSVGFMISGSIDVGLILETHQLEWLSP